MLHFLDVLRDRLPRGDSRRAAPVAIGRPTWQLLAEEEGNAAAVLPVVRIRREMAAAAELAFGLGEEANGFAAALEAQMPALAANPELRDMLGATRVMIMRAEAAERLLRKCGDEIDHARRTLGELRSHHDVEARARA